jgi:16S rRNA C967 or C1407 C5-methylase (RsmB/RsmF family)
VEWILVDPSCSGSGMVDRIDSEGKQHLLAVLIVIESTPERLANLSRFQYMILSHALKCKYFFI